MSNDRDVKPDNTSMSIEEIRERWSKATPGPWLAQGAVSSGTGSEIIGTVGGGIVAKTLFGRDADHVACAHAPSDVALLLAEISFLRSLLKDHGISIPDRKVR